MPGAPEEGPDDSARRPDRWDPGHGSFGVVRRVRWADLRGSVQGHLSAVRLHPGLLGSLVRRPRSATVDKFDD